MHLTSTITHPADQDVFDHWLHHAEYLRAATDALSEYLD